MSRRALRHPVRTPLRLVALAVAAVLATAGAAVAHPGFRPDEVPAGGPVAVELVVPHGCGDEAGGGGASPTVLVLAQEADEFVLVPSTTPGWEVQAEDGAFGWRAVDGGTADELVLPALVEVTAAVGTQLDVAVYQECADGQSYRWAAAAGEDGDPAVRLTVVEGTPPPLPTPTPSPTPSPVATPTSTPAPTPAPTPTPTPSPTPTPGPTAGPSPGASPGASPTAAAADLDDGGVSVGLVGAVLAGLVVLALAVTAVVRRRGTGPVDDSTGGSTGGSGAGTPGADGPNTTGGGA